MIVFDGHNDTLTRLYPADPNQKHTFFEEVTGCRLGLPKLIQQLEIQGYNQAAIKKIAYQNCLEMLRDTWKA